MPASQRTPFLRRRTLVAARVTLNRTMDVALIVDTGAELTVISRDAATRLGIDLSRPLRWQPLVGVGQTRPVPVVCIEEIRVGGMAVGRVDVSVYDLPSLFQADRLLGMNFLNRFRVTFEFDTRTLVLRMPPTNAGTAPRQASVPQS